MFAHYERSYQCLPITIIIKIIQRAWLNFDSQMRLLSSMMEIGRGLFKAGQVYFIPMYVWLNKYLVFRRV